MRCCPIRSIARLKRWEANLTNVTSSTMHLTWNHSGLDPRLSFTAQKSKWRRIREDEQRRLDSGFSSQSLESSPEWFHVMWHWWGFPLRLFLCWASFHHCSLHNSPFEVCHIPDFIKYSLNIDCQKIIQYNTIKILDSNEFYILSCDLLSFVWWATSER
jgi:hypothetical protein